MYFILKRFFDIFISLVALVLLLPLLIVVTLIIIISSGFPVFFLQKRVGKNWKEFKIIKFRSMVKNADLMGPGVSVKSDKRITLVGNILRKYKIDELPQFFNVLIGNMSIIGPRPELLKYAEKYKLDYDTVLKIKPGITDYASIYFRNEEELLNKTDNCESFYVQKILPEKIKLYKKYINDISFLTDVKILLKTVKVIFK